MQARKIIAVLVVIALPGYALADISISGIPATSTW